MEWSLDVLVDIKLASFVVVPTLKIRGQMGLSIILGRPPPPSEKKRTKKKKHTHTHTESVLCSVFLLASLGPKTVTRKPRTSPLQTDLAGRKISVKAEAEEATRMEWAGWGFGC